MKLVNFGNVWFAEDPLERRYSIEYRERTGKYYIRPFFAVAMHTKPADVFGPIDTLEQAIIIHALFN